MEKFYYANADKATPKAPSPVATTTAPANVVKTAVPVNVVLTPNQQERIRNIQGVQMGVSLIGSIGGVIYAKRTGGGFWRYVGYWILGGLITGVPAALIAVPLKNKILKESDK
jgi:hypothetical protein